MIERPPSAELRPDQLDSDSLPAYDLLDRILEAYVERDQGREEMIAAGHAGGDRRRGDPPGRPLRVQAPPGGAGDPHHPARLRQGPPPADHQPLRRSGRRLASRAEHATRPRPRQAPSGRGRTAMVIVAVAQRRSWSSTDFGVPDPGGAAAVAGAGADFGVALGDRADEVDADRLAHRDRCRRPRPASAVAREQMLSTRRRETPPCRSPTGWRSSSRSATRTRASSGSSSSHSVPIRTSKWERQSASGRRPSAANPTGGRD